MLLNSYEFVFAFLPFSLIVFYALRPVGRSAQQLAVIFLSLVFYSFWAGTNTFLLLASVITNFALAHAIWRHRSQQRVAFWLLTVGVFLNLTYLGYFKYSHFVVEQIFGFHTVYLADVLPLGISFFTFTQLMYLVDLYRGNAKPELAGVFGAFVTFYPHLPAGPLYHYSEIMPQLKVQPKRPLRADLAVGWTIFVFGLAKKILADAVAPIADAAFSAPAHDLTAYAAWTGALAYSLQIYFDFSGYSDMAIGIARMFGIILPENFRSPYKAADIIDFWRRWHITLSRFLRDYLYIPLGGNRRGESRRFANILITMLIGGLWHGANWTFIFWGGLHGLFLVINHAWRLLPVRLTVPKVISVALTFVSVMLAWVLFRANSLEQALNFLQTMAGIGAKPMPVGELYEYFTNLPTILSSTWARDVAWMATGIVVMWAAPNTQEIMCDFQPVLSTISGRPALLIWRPKLRWAITITTLFGFCVTQMATAKVFLYWSF